MIYLFAKICAFHMYAVGAKAYRHHICTIGYP
jgi:hypothetical protein